MCYPLQMLAITRTLALGLLGYLFPRILIGLGIPLDTLAANLASVLLRQFGIVAATFEHDLVGEFLGVAIALILMTSEWYWGWAGRIISRLSPNPRSGNENAKDSESDIIILPPENYYVTIWDPPKDLQIVTRPKWHSPLKHHSDARLPLFRMKNVGGTVLQKISISWDFLLTPSIDSFVQSSPIFTIYKFSWGNGLYGFEATDPSGNKGWAAAYAEKDVENLPYLAPTIDNESYVYIAFPPRVWASIEIAALYLLSRQEAENALRRRIALPSCNLKFSILAEWEHPKSSHERFDFLASIQSTKPVSNGAVTMPMDGKMRPPPAAMFETRFKSLP